MRYYSTANWKLNRQFYQIKQSLHTIRTRNSAVCWIMAVASVVAEVCVLLLARELAYFSDANVDLNLLKLCTMAKMLMMVRRRRPKCFHYNGYALVTFTYRSVAPNQSTFLITNRMETHQNGAEQKNREWQIDFIFSPAIRRRRDETLGHRWTQCECACWYCNRIIKTGFCVQTDWSANGVCGLAMHVSIR